MHTSRRNLTFALSLVLLAGCPSGNNAPDVGDMAGDTGEDSDHRFSRLVLVTEPEPMITFDQRVPLQVRYVDPDNVPIPDAFVSFRIVGEAGDTRLSVEDGRTDNEGSAETVIEAGKTTVDFDLEVAVMDDTVEPLVVLIRVEPPPPLPDRAYARSADDLPPGTTIISEEELDTLIADGAVVVSIGTVKAAQDAAKAQEDEDDRIIAEWEDTHPGRTLLPEDQMDPGSMSLPNGTTLITVAMANGETREFEAMGDRWVKGEITSALQTFGTRENQLGVYEELYNRIPIQYRDQLGLVAPAEVIADPLTYDVTVIRTLNSAIIARADEIAIWRPVPNTPPGYVANCDLEERAGEGSDRDGSDYSDPACAPDPDGIRANVDFPMRWYATCVKDQGNRGTCVSFAGVSAMELLVAKDDARWVNLSEQALYRKMKFEWEYPRRDLSDGFLTHNLFPSFGFWRLPYEEAWNYNPSLNRIRDYEFVDAPWYEGSCDDYDEPCSESTHQTPLFCAEVSGVMECAYGWIGFDMQTATVGVSTSAQLWNHDDLDQSIQLMRLALWMGFPLVLGYDCGWYCGHAVNVVGFVDNGDLADTAPLVAAGAGGGYFIIKNSYSNCHGDAGYDYFDYDFMKENAKSVTALHGVF